jgi:DNA-binding HxlR family transcriptional regulator
MTPAQVFPTPGADGVGGRLPPVALEEGPFSARFHHAAEIVGRRWTGAVLYALHHGLDRFTDLRNAVPGLSSRLLTERLRELESEGIVERTDGPAPGGGRYRLTAKGDDLRPVLIAVNRWAHRWDAGAPSVQPASVQGPTPPMRSTE